MTTVKSGFYKGYNEAQAKVMSILNLKEPKALVYTSRRRAMTGVVLFEENANVIGANRTEDANIIEKFIQQTGLKEFYPDTRNSPPTARAISIARAGNGQQPYFGIVKGPWAPAHWEKWCENVKSTAASIKNHLNPDFPEAYNNFTGEGKTNGSWFHSEANAAIRLIRNEGSQSTVFLTTGKDLDVCSRCIHADGSGLSVTIHALRNHQDRGGTIAELKVWGTSDRRFGNGVVRDRTAPDKPWVLTWDATNSFVSEGVE